jgi:hypothetical protein
MVGSKLSGHRSEMLALIISPHMRNSEISWARAEGPFGCMPVSAGRAAFELRRLLVVGGSLRPPCAAGQDRPSSPGPPEGPGLVTVTVTTADGGETPARGFGPGG